MYYPPMMGCMELRRGWVTLYRTILNDRKSRCLSSTGFFCRSHTNQRCPCRRQAASRGPRLVRYNALDFASKVVRQGAAPLWNPARRAGQHDARPVRKSAFCTLFCGHEKRPESTVFRTLFNELRFSFSCFSPMQFSSSDWAAFLQWNTLLPAIG